MNGSPLTSLTATNAAIAVRQPRTVYSAYDQIGTVITGISPTERRI